MINKSPLINYKRRLFALFSLTVPILLSACFDPDPQALYSDLAIESSCEQPVNISYYTATDGVTLSDAEENDLLISAIGLIPSLEDGSPCDRDRTVRSYRFSHPQMKREAVTQYVKFEGWVSQKPSKTIEDSLLGQKTAVLIQDGQCQQVWEYLTPLVVAGSSEAAGVLWGTTAYTFSTQKPGKNNGITTPRQSEFGLTGQDFEYTLINTSFLSGPNAIILTPDEIMDRAVGYFNVQFKDFKSQTGCNFESPTFECQKMIVEAGLVDPIELYFDYMLKARPKKTIKCYRGM